MRLLRCVASDDQFVKISLLDLSSKSGFIDQVIIVVAKTPDHANHMRQKNSQFCQIDYQNLSNDGKLQAAASSSRSEYMSNISTWLSFGDIDWGNDQESRLDKTTTKDMSDMLRTF
jgi:hypothetical protein